MIDVVIFAIPADEPRAGAILDAMKSRGEAGKYRTRFVIAHPAGADWRTAKGRAGASDCVIFVFSAATDGQDTLPYRRLAETTHAEGRAIAVELDPGSLPAALAGCSTYLLDGPRANPAWWFRALFGNPHKNLIVAAATDKAEGRDPPSHAALRGIALKQFWQRLLGVAAVIGVISSILGISGTEPVQKWWNAEKGRAFAAAKAKGCPGVRAYSREPANQGSPWQDEVTAYLADCPAAEKEVEGEHRQPLQIVVGMSEAKAHSSEAQARQASADAAREKARADCDMAYSSMGGRVQSVRLDRLSQSCGPKDGGTACSIDALAICSIAMPQIASDQRLP